MLAVNALRPPGEQRGRPDKITTTAQFDNSRRLNVLEFVNGGEMGVDKNGVGQRPQMLDGLEFRRMRREVHGRDEFPMFQHGVALRLVARQAVKVDERDHPLAIGPHHADGGVEAITREDAIAWFTHAGYVLAAPAT
jgi:hypothetical protein